MIPALTNSENGVINKYSTTSGNPAALNNFWMPVSSLGRFQGHAQPDPDYGLRYESQNASATTPTGLLAFLLPGRRELIMANPLKP